MSKPKELIDREAFRLLDMLQERDPGDGSYGTILTNIEHLLGIRQFAIEVLADSEVEGPEEHYPMLVHNVEEKTEAAPVETETKVDAAPVETETKVDAAPVETKTYTKEEVRAALGAARKTGLNVAEFLQGMGFANFTAVPAAEYPKIMEAIQHGA